jgi:isopentenyl-diphosphate Delta-isomerase
MAANREGAGPHRCLDSKAGHIDAALDGGSEVSTQARKHALGFDDLRFRPRALPEVNFEDIDLSLDFLGKRIALPLMISPMTGGMQRGATYNRKLAEAAERHQIPFGVGSQRVALEVPERAKDFQIRSVAPSIPIFANLGAVQLVKGYDADSAQRAVDMIEADALYLHINAMQEVVQEGGDVNWEGVLRAIETLCRRFHQRDAVPVFVREVGFGISEDEAKRLWDAGVDGIDCSGGGGTSWSLLEGRVAKDPVRRRLGETFAAWGLTTPEAILEVRRANANRPLIASGGIRTGLDVAKCLALGANLAGMASPLIRAVEAGDDVLEACLRATALELRAALFGVGAKDLATFRAQPRLIGHSGPVS